MKKYLLIILLFFSISNLQAKDNLVFYIGKAIENNLQLNAERKNFESAKQDKNISRSEFLPSITLSGDQTSTTSTNRTNQSGASLADSNSDTESKKISVEQKIFSLIDKLIFLKVPSFKYVFKWRLLQEKKLRITSKGKKTMTDKEIENFIMFYERLTKHMLKNLSKNSDTVINIDKQHRLKSIKFN